MDPQEELSEFITRLNEFVAKECPSWLTPNSFGSGVMPGHNLDLMQIWFDFRIDRTWLLTKGPIPASLKDPSKLEVVK